MSPSDGLVAHLSGGSTGLRSGELVRFGSGWRHATTTSDLFRGLLHCTLLLLTVVLMVTAGSHAHAQRGEQSSQIWFDIPSQPIASALDAYSTTTGIVAVYNGNLAAGRRSNAVRGHLAPEIALLSLLKDSGLVAEYTTSDAFVLVPASEEPGVVKTPSAIALAALSQQDSIERRYSAVVQERITSALCAQQETKPGAYRAAISFWIGPAGGMTRVKLLSSTGDQQRDAAIAEVAGRLSVGEAPPAHMAQPFTMVVLPRSSGGTIDCPAAEIGRQHG
jgi:hypothetical protein